eukprot:CAMPEP_0170502770 /NCGR_PEP_ID=MMETSP0208-20121228/42522_1 /TAXON_ID=197538 /ORGANISM="Strombidium inclinatum, Strain S3" /LENGTH=93 /DNA_ID=CAMNT_0010782041 /DNA_START=145 /DNA_END=422 /DNA_ORIENTATION=-
MITPSAAGYSNFKGGPPNKSSNLLDDQFVTEGDVFAAESVKEGLRKRDEEKSAGKSAGKSSGKKKRALSSNFLEIKVEQTDPQTPMNPQYQRP